MKPSEILRAARPLLGKWCRGKLGIGVTGDAADYKSERCVGRCIRGALYAAGPFNSTLSEADKYLERAARNRGVNAKYPESAYVQFNDQVCVDSADAGRLFDEAIQLAESENQ